VICQKCGNKGVLSSALGKDFWYCRTCKDEIRLDVVSPAPSGPDKKDELWGKSLAGSSTLTLDMLKQAYQDMGKATTPLYPTTPGQLWYVPLTGLKCPCPDPMCTTTYTYDPNTDIYIDNAGFSHMPIDLVATYGKVPG
jgi:hypothetical protein